MKKIKNVAWSFLPTLMWLLIQAAVATGFTIGITFLSGIFRGMQWESRGLAEYLNRNGVYIISVLMDAVVLIPGILWYRHLRYGEMPCTESGINFTKKAWGRVILLGIFIQLVTDIALIMTQLLAPRAMEEYRRVLESLGMFSPGIWSVMYTVVLAPAAEELIFRGLTLKILEREFSFWTANLLQALYFAFIHGNLVQGIYAFGAGIILGCIIGKYRTMKAAVLCHFAVNLSGLLFSGINLNILHMVAGAALLGIGIFLLKEKTE